MRIVIYARVSLGDDKQDPNNQLVPLRQFAQALGGSITGEYVDYCSGGSSDRPQFQKMLSEADRHAFDMILVWALDRFSREGISNTFAYMDRLDRANVSLKSMREGWLDTQDKGIGRLILAIFAWVAEQERLRISDRVKAGLRGKKNVGKRGKDAKPRRKGGYWLRWQKNKGDK